MARRYNGKFIVRIEDTDRTRKVEGAVEEILESLRWLGLDWDEGPIKGGDYAPYFQSERLELYHKICNELIRRGAAYKCFCTPEELDKMREYQRINKLPTMYDRRCRMKQRSEIEKLEQSGMPYVIRLAMPSEGTITFEDAIRGTVEYEASLIDDQILLKSDGWPTYHLANVVDDHYQEITHVIRGDEWISSTPKHVVLYHAMEWELPVFAHAPIIKGPDGAKLSKRHGDVACLEFREKGYLPQAVVNFIALIGWSPGGDKELMTLREMEETFSLEGIQPSPGIFDITKLQWMNGYYIRQLTPPDLYRTVKEFDATTNNEEYLSSPKRKTLHEAFEKFSEEYVTQALVLEQERVKLLPEFASACDFFFEEEPEFDPAAREKWFSLEYVVNLFDFLITHLENKTTLTPEDCEKAITEATEKLGLEKRSMAIHPTRVALTGRTHGPGLFELMALLGPDRIRKRLERARNNIENTTEKRKPAQ